MNEATDFKVLLICSSPRWMLHESLEFLNENFDATLVADLTVNGLLALVFLFTRILTVDNP